MNRIGVRAGTLVAALSLLAPAIQAGLNHWTSIGPEGGPISVLVTDPRRPGSIYASGGTLVFHSSDRGDHWAPLDLGLDILVRRLVIDPRDSRLYLAGSEALLMSDDQGGHWSRIGQELSGLELYDVTLDSGNPDALAVATNKGVWMSSDRGATWRQQLSTEEVRSVRVSGAGIFAVTRFHQLAVSRDAGHTWWVGYIEEYGVVDLALDPGDPDTVYLSIEYGAQLLKSTDGGRNWSPACSGLPVYGCFLRLYADPRSPGTVYGALWDQDRPDVGRRVFVTRDGAASWTPFACPGAFASLAFDPEDIGTIYTGTQGEGVFRSTDQGGHWETINQGLAASDVHDIEALPDSRILAGVHGQGILSRSGDSWLTLVSSRNLSGNIDADPHQPGHVFATIQDHDYSFSALYETGDGGATWQKNPVELHGETAKVAVSPDRPQTVYIAIAYMMFEAPQGGVIKSTDGGISWGPTGTGKNSPTWDVVVSPGQPDTVYIVCGDDWNWGSARHGIYKTVDGGATWKQIHPDEYVFSLVVDPRDPNTIYAGARGVVYKSTDAGGAWQDLDLNSPASDVVALAIDPQEPALLWAGLNAHGRTGSKSGVFVSSDGGVSWQEFNDGLGCRAITCLAIDPSRPRSVCAGTEGGGAWTLQLDRPRMQRQPSRRPGR